MIGVKCLANQHIPFAPVESLMEIGSGQFPQLILDWHLLRQISQGLAQPVVARAESALYSVNRKDLRPCASVYRFAFLELLHLQTHQVIKPDRDRRHQDLSA